MIYAIERSGGSVSIMRILLNSSIEEELAKWPEEDRASVVSYKEIDESEIPTDRHFREAWDYDLKINMGKARDIHMDRIRAARDEKLKALDIETMKGRDVQAEKQALRDIPQTLDLSTATTPEELKALWPQELEK